MPGGSQQDPDGFEPTMMANAISGYPSFRGHHRRHSSTPDEMLTIDENHEQNFSDTRPFVKSSVTVTETPVLAQDGRRTSMLRRLTTKLRSPISGSVYRSRPSERQQYANIHESSGDCVPVDLSSLVGLGFELREVANVPSSSRHVYEQDTSYRGVDDNDDDDDDNDDDGAQIPSFRDFRQRNTLGSGMVIGAHLKRDPSKLDSSTTSARAMSMQDHAQRSKTVRKLGQNLAEERGQIIAYSENVDLSTLEGARLRHRSSSTFEDMRINRASTAIPDTQSYFFPKDPQIPNWKPWSMRSPYILTLIFVAFGLAGFQEFLCQTSMRRQAGDIPSGLLAFNSLDDLSVWWFFVWKYLPTMVTILYSVMYSIMDFDIRRLEPYYQLSQPQGARASASLNLDHLTMFQYFVPFNAARLRQWAVFASTFANIIAATIAPALQNPSINFEANPDGRCKDRCPPDTGMQKYWVLIDPLWSRPLSVAYLLIAITLTYLFFQLRRKSGLLSDPRGIAGIASMATKSHILQDFKGLDLATRGDIHKKLAHRTYLLYKSSIWQGEWDPTIEQPQGDSNRRLQSPHPMMLRLTAGIPFIGLLVICLACVPIISLTPARVVPNTVPWLPILVATILKMIWSTFEADVRLIEPFYQLSNGNALPQNSLTLDYQSTMYGWMPIRAALNGHFLVSLVGLTSVCLDILSVTISSFSVDSAVFLEKKNSKLPLKKPELSDGDETYISFFASLILSITILTFAICVASLVYARRRHPFLPREPSTIAAVLAFIYSSKMLTDFIDTETLDAKQMEARLKTLGKRYALGWFVGRDRKVHCAIDEEPMLSRYVHNKPYHQAVAGPLSMGDVNFP
ncbi:hypothetical protein H2198_009061 [Neophaeococcomyces mojaviensis]|uniref:Uncharacterized protein n=1 Tax=Neophaeococcomyces mojaviensis TaxID=3383035 RepID=A0ACC2ZVI7_9EURO|nr:hypothetical protein H2198_009061 [Knufia sp. JES_112]